MFFAKFRSHRVKNQKVMTENLSQLNALVDKLLLNFGAKFQRLYYYMRNLCNLIGLEQWYFSLIYI